jgi:hypothetical protein
MKFTNLIQLNEIIIGTIYFMVLYAFYGIISNKIGLFDFFYTTVAFMLTYGTMIVIYNYYIFQKTL